MMQMSSLSRSFADRGAVLRTLGFAVLGSAILAASAQVALPMWPVPATLQSLAVLLLGALGGAPVAVGALALYLAEGAMGLPVFAAGTAGPAVLMGPTAGYFLGFFLAALIASQARGGWLRTGAVLTVAHVALFVPGVLWLAGFVGLEKALTVGFVLFVPATVVKTALALAATKALGR